MQVIFNEFNFNNMNKINQMEDKFHYGLSLSVYLVSFLFFNKLLKKNKLTLNLLGMIFSIAVFGFFLNEWNKGVESIYKEFGVKRHS